jgi:hypothetical protein
MMIVIVVVIVRPGQGMGGRMLVRPEVEVIVVDHMAVDQVHVPERHVLHDRAGQPGGAEQCSGHPERDEGAAGV